jgi:hypothetical protein
VSEEIKAAVAAFFFLLLFLFVDSGGNVEIVGDPRGPG